MLALKKLAVTGGLSSGKSSVCVFLQELGAFTVSADEIVHQLLSPKTKIGKEVIRLFGDEILKDGDISRFNIAQIVFADKEKLLALERLLHPAVIEEIERRYREIQTRGKYSLFAAEIPLLYESESEHLFDYVVAVLTDPLVAQKRFESSYKEPSNSDFEKRMSRQWDPKEKAAKADFVITNNGSLDELKKHVKNLYDQVKE